MAAATTRRGREAPKAPPRERLELRIERLVAGGAGLARTSEGQVVLVGEAAPGDRVEVEVTEARRGYLRGRVTRVLEAGPGRREPPCPLALRCGGCTLQHLAYDAQVEAKLGILRESFARTGRIVLPEPIRVHRSAEWGTRRRARFHVERGSGGARLGFHERGSRRLVPVGPCPVLTPALEAALPALARAARGPELQVLDAEDGILVEGDGRTGTVHVAGERLVVSSTVFFQSHAPLLEALVARVVELAAGEPGPDGAPRPSLALDLYAGVGLFTMPLARRFATVAAVEGVKAGARLLAQNARTAGQVNVETHAAAVEEALDGPLRGRIEGAVLIVDPPREGLSAQVRERIASGRPARLVYVACDPVALARDAAALAPAGLELRSVDLFDLYPQTHHLEAVALLARSPGS